MKSSIQTEAGFLGLSFPPGCRHLWAGSRRGVGWRCVVMLVLGLGGGVLAEGPEHPFDDGRTERSAVNHSEKKGGKLRWTTDSGLKIRVSGKFHFDLTDGRNSDEEMAYDASFRRLRLALKGEQKAGFHFKIQCDFSDDGEAEWKDAYVGFEFSDRLTIRIGQMKEPIGFEWLTGSNDLLLAERAPQTECLPNREVGVTGSGELGHRVTWALGTFLNADDLGHAAEDDDEPGRSDVTARLTWMPWGKGKNARFLHLGLAGSVRDWDDDVFEIESSGSLSTGPTLFDLPKLRASSVQLWASETALSLGRVFLQSETLITEIDGLTDVRLRGSYLTVRVGLTGEHRRVKNQELSGLKPARPFRFRSGAPDFGGGAWELVARYALLETTRSPVPDQQLRDAVLGVSWTADEDIRILLNGVTSVLDAASSRTETRGLHLRFQMGF